MSVDPKEVTDFHKRSDVDASFKAQHHTLGKKANQAAPGNHTHTGVDSEPIIIPDSGVQSIEEGSSNVHVDSSDPAHPIISVDEPVIPEVVPVQRMFIHKFPGALSVGVGDTLLYNDTDADWEILSIRASVETAPAGDVRVDGNVNGTTIFTNQANRPHISTGNLTSGPVTNMDITTVPVGDYFSLDVDEADTPSAELTVIVVYQ